jgi:hypothetical protein
MQIISKYPIGAIAQLGERLPCTQEVCGSIPHSSTNITLNEFWLENNQSLLTVLLVVLFMN